MMFMKQIFIKVVLMLRFGGLAGFGYRRQRRTLGESDMSPETMRTKSGVHFTVNSVARNGSFRNGFKSFAETFFGRHCRSAGIPKQLVGISVGEKANPQMSSKFSLFVRNTTIAFSPRRGCPPAVFPLLLSALFGNFYPVWRSA